MGLVGAEAAREVSPRQPRYHDDVERWGWRGLIPLGVDVNLRGLGVAVVLRRGARGALELVARRAARYGMEAALIGDCVALYGYLDFGVPSFAEYVASMLTSLVRKYAEEVEVLESLGVNVPLTSPRMRGGAPEAGLIAKMVAREVERHGLSGLPPLFSRELQWLVHYAGKKWTAAYKFAVRVTCQKAAAIARRLARAHTVVVKLEDLHSIHSKAVSNPATKRWCYAKIREYLLRALPPSVRVGLVDPAHTSTLTPCCRAKAKARSYRTLVCPTCGREWHRDAMAAVNIALAKVERWLR